MALRRKHWRQRQGYPSMDDHLEWLMSGLIFLWILGAYDARPGGPWRRPMRVGLAERVSARRSGLFVEGRRSSRKWFRTETITQSCHMPATGPGTETGAR